MVTDSICTIPDNKLEPIQTDGSFQALKHETSIGKISVSSCEDVQFGPKFIANTINYIDRTRKKPIRHILMIIIVTVLLLCILIVIIIKRNPSKPGPAPTITPPPTSKPTTKSDISTVTSPSPPPAPSPTPPEHWYVPYTEWSITPPLDCYSIISNAALTVSIDTSDSCDNIDALRILQASDGLHHNFYITQTCQVYEGFGWSCSAEYSQRYSRTNLVIAICGELQQCQETVLETLLEKGVTQKLLNTKFNVIPECCRGTHNKKGPGTELSKYLIEKYALDDRKTFPNSACLSTASCVIL